MPADCPTIRQESHDKQTYIYKKCIHDGIHDDTSRIGKTASLIPFEPFTIHHPFATPSSSSRALVADPFPSLMGILGSSFPEMFCNDSIVPDELGGKSRPGGLASGTSQEKDHVHSSRGIASALLYLHSFTSGALKSKPITGHNECQPQTATERQDEILFRRKPFINTTGCPILTCDIGCFKKSCSKHCRTEGPKTICAVFNTWDVALHHYIIPRPKKVGIQEGTAFGEKKTNYNMILRSMNDTHRIRDCHKCSCIWRVSR